MFNVNVAKADRAALLEAAKAIRVSGIAASPDGAAHNNALIAQANAIGAAIQRHEAASMPAGPEDNVPGVVSPMGRVSQKDDQPQWGYRPASGVGAGLSSRIRAALASAPSDVREQVEGFQAYLNGDIRAAANLSPAGDGAVVIPKFVFDAVERNYIDFSPVESVARVWGTETGADVVYPVLSDSETAVQLDAAAATGADDTVSGDTPPTALTGPTLHAYKVSSKPVFIPRETATDSNIDIIGEIILSLYARIARFENLRYTKGTGSGQAEGFLTNATKLVTGAVALDLDIALDLAYNVPALYRSGSVYMLSDTTAKYLRKIKTGISGDKQQLWADADATKGTPATLHGYPVVINNDMDSVDADGTFAARNPIAFGNFSKFIVRKAEQGRTFIRRYEVPAKDGAAAILFRRSDSKLIVPAAISKVAVS